LTKAEQNAIAEDKAMWAVAIKWFRDKQQARIKLAELMWSFDYAQKDTEKKD
jgi:hypothetical protein